MENNSPSDASCFTRSRGASPSGIAGLTPFFSDLQGILPLS
ncbi:unnamed protein product [Chondrus crispus]|uniref:Uncharacterized protein n=1 Tax=Chondrus crispus TaxID=2769 RepID=R7QUH1_CHOCR|nr:unnamed protein product [Chondrus crispus]CDF41333.1 unnamed protein product [Chondrus crispus]|eukprot:XP_005711627.1 unnamed protein product [Chondrus crispus]